MKLEFHCPPFSFLYSLFLYVCHHIGKINTYCNTTLHLYKSILIFQHISRCFEEQKVTPTCFLSLFLLGMGRKRI
ncbi:hypothetical protein FOS08_00615 [Bacillus pseudomycoides]|uniref:Uncharacterized protein n=1 Tax=Bacillus pseudomycoides TaxID=64104 RepID=A0AAJ1YU86_9BACI|nr:hypothetical protein [Bacillus pseudomycoides]